MTTDQFKKEFLNGKVLLFDKPLYWTSFDLVRKVRNALKTRLELHKVKVGHAGTLDPLATGLMILCTGKETRNIERYQSAPKEYQAKIRFGATTPSFDLETPIDHHYPFSHVTHQGIEKVLDDMKGRQLQIPPDYSAKSVNGVRAYSYARKGKSVALAPKEIEIFSIGILSVDMPDIEIHITCSKGTYIRSIARDIGTKLGSGAHLTALMRTRIGEFELKDALKVEDFERNLVLL
jgi:tRNA pseudouridine55 synthase